METVFAQRLKSARIMKGFSMDALCNVMGHMVSKQSLSKYENAKMLPDSTVLIALSKALEVSVDYLFRPYQIEMPSIEFRKKSRLKVTEVNSIKEKVRDRIESYFEIENMLDINAEFKVDFSNISVQRAEDVKALALRLRREWNLGEDAIGNIISILEDNEVKVIELNASKEFDGLSGYVNHSFPIIVLNNNFTAERKRFTALHELGHLLLNFDPSLSQIEKESYCNLFANEMLIPGKQFIRQIGSSRKDISLLELIPLQKQFGISIDALMYKAKELNVISEQRYRTYCIKKNGDPGLKEMANECRYSKEYSDRFERLIYRAVASEVISYSKAAALLGTPVHELKANLTFV
ncbi:MAG: ImmA/IrrE family metallo-endopeptidase [Tannerellaceae bacterium]|nr:ImmA/IrrE family metallo-endopeptidase [Tannerellaceae bacterium]